jgi:hypothetical protein
VERQRCCGLGVEQIVRSLAERNQHLELTGLRNKRKLGLNNTLPMPSRLPTRGYDHAHEEQCRLTQNRCGGSSIRLFDNAAGTPAAAACRVGQER